MRSFIFIVFIFSFLSGQEIGKPFVDRGGHSGYISKIKVSMDDKYALTYSNKEIILWDIEKAKMVRIFQNKIPKKIFQLLKFKKIKKQKNCKYGKYQYLHNTDAIRVSKDCKYFDNQRFRNDYSCYIFDNLTGKQVEKLSGGDGCTVEFTNKDKAFIHFWYTDSPSEHYIQIYDTKKNQLLKQHYSATKIKYTHNQKYLLIGKVTGELEVYDLINKISISS